jgi:phosphatidylglycerophosphatase A
MGLRSKPYGLTVAVARPAAGSGWERAQHWLAIGGPIGLIPWVPATWASLFTALVCWWAPPRPVVIMAIAAGLFVAGVFAASTAERLTGIEDPRNVVLDEIAGQLLTFLFVAPTSGWIMLAGFGLFRLFDVLKPPPARAAERLRGGWGIMADDYVAGVYAALVLWLLVVALRHLS